MRNRKKILCVTGHILYFMAGFYIIIMGFMNIPALPFAVIVSIYFPGLVCIESLYINFLIKELNETEDELIMQSCKAEFYKNRQKRD